MMLWVLLKSSLFFFPFCLKACLDLSLLSSFLMQCFMNLDHNCVCDENFVTQEMIPRYAPMIWYVCYVKYDIMCTSDVVGNTQRLVSMGKIHKIGLCGYQCNGKNDVSRYQDEVTVSCLRYGVKMVEWLLSMTNPWRR